MKKPVKSDQKLKIGFVMDTSLDPPDGVQQYVLAISAWLRSQGHEIHYIVGETVRTDLDNIHSVSKNINVTFNGNKMSIPLWARRNSIKRLLDEHAFDVLHVQSPYHPLMAQYIINQAPKTTAVVSTFHILPYGRAASIGTALLGLALRKSLKRIDKALAVSKSAAVFQQQKFGLKSEVSPNVFDYKRFADADSLPQYQDDIPTIVFLGRLVERKGSRLLLEAAALLRRGYSEPFRIVVCGKGAQLAELQKYANENGLSDIVEFAGFVSEEDKPKYLASADISVFPSKSGESFGIVLIEAMASGKSVVLAGNNPGYATVMEPFDDQLFDPTNAADLAALLRKYLSNTAMRRSAAQAGGLYVQEFDVGHVGPQLVNHYELAIASLAEKQHNKA